MNRKILIFLVALAAVLVLASCGALTPDQAEAAAVGLKHSLDQGLITQAQFDAAVEALRNDTGVDWDVVGTVIGGVAFNLIAAFLGIPALVRKQRGPAGMKRDEVEHELAELRRQVADAKANG